MELVNKEEESRCHMTTVMSYCSHTNEKRWYQYSSTVGSWCQNLHF